MDAVRSVLNSFDAKALKSQVENDNGLFKISLDGTDIELKHKTHFFLNAKERQA